MAMITHSEYGIVAVNNSVISKMIIDNMLSMETRLLPSNKKGKPLKKGMFTGYNELYNSVELIETSDGIKVKVYFLTQNMTKYEETSDELFNKIESDFKLLCLDKPLELRAHIKGFMVEKKVEARDVEMVRKNDL